jgi:hypothetical protein
VPSVVVKSAAAVLLATSLVALSSRAGAEPSCTTAYEDSQLLRRRGELMAAREAAVACARTQCPAVSRKDCTAWVTELEREIPSVIVIARDEATGDEGGARVSVDGAPRPDIVTGRAFSLDPGPHAFRVEKPGSEPAEQTITIVRGEHDRVVRFVLRAVRAEAPRAATVPRPAPAPEPSTSPRAQPSYVPAIVAGVATLAAFGVSAGFGLTGRSELSNLRGSCAPSCTDEELDAMRTKLLISDVALGVGLVGALVTTFLVVSPPIYYVDIGRARVGVAPAAGAGAVAMSGTF